MTQMSGAAEQAAPERREKVQRKRGTGFPIVPLSECVDVMRTAGKHGTEHSISAFATYLGHSTPNSGSFKRRIASFRDWKFIANATGGRVVFTDLGKRIAYPTHPAKGRGDLHQAFENCAIFMKVWDDQAKGVPISLNTLANHGVQVGVSPVSKQQFAESLAESAATAGFARLEGDKVVFVRPSDHDEVISVLPTETPAQMRRDAIRELPHSDQLVEDNSRRRQKFLEEVDAASRGAEPERVRIAGSVENRAMKEADAWRIDERKATAMEVEEPYLSEEPEPLYVRPERPGALRQSVRARARADEQQRVMFQQQRVMFQQEWDFHVGNLVFEIKSSRILPAESFMQLAKVMVEVEKLKELLAKDVESAESDE